MKRSWLLIATFCACLAATPTLPAQDTGAIASGNWNNPAIWTAGTVPGLGNNVFIGSNYPLSSATSATVLLTQNQQSDPIYLGYAAGSSGTLNLGNFNINATSLNIGNGGGSGTVLRGTGSVQAGGLNIYSGNSFNFSSADVVGGLGLSGNATASTASTGNITGNVLATSGSTLTLGAPLSVSGSIDIAQAGTTLNAQGFNISANQLYLGWSGAGAALVNRGTISVNTFYLLGQAFQLTSSDSVSTFNLYNASTNLGVGVSVNNMQLRSNSTATTASSGNLSGAVQIISGSTLTLGAPLIANTVDVADPGSILNAQGNNITASQFYLGWSGAGAALVNRGTISANTFYLLGQAFQLTSSDSVSTFNLNNASTNLGAGVSINNMQLRSNSTATTASSGNLSGAVEIISGSTLTLGAPLNAFSVNVADPGSILNAQGNNITASQFFLGWGGGPVSFLNDGAVNIGSWFQGSTTTSLRNGNDVMSGMTLISSSQLHITDAPGQSSGLTILGSSNSAISIDATSKIILDLDGLSSDWILRWANPNGGDHIADLTNLIALGRIELNNPGNYDYQIYSSSDGFTYVTNAVPEPASILLLGGVGAAFLGYYRFKKVSARREYEAKLNIH